MRKVPIKLSELVETWTMGNDESWYYLNLETGSLEYYWPDGDVGDLDIEEIEDSPNWLKLPHDDSRTGYQDMEAFVEDLDDERLAELLRVAITGKGAFRRFKDVLLNYPQAREAWFAYQASRVTERVREWLEDNDFELA